MMRSNRHLPAVLRALGALANVVETRRIFANAVDRCVTVILQSLKAPQLVPVPRLVESGVGGRHAQDNCLPVSSAWRPVRGVPQSRRAGGLAS